MDGEPQHWVFGYGSLMWRPGFAFAERRPAVLKGWRRAFCIYSIHHRGRPGRPGLVLGLAEGGAVKGVAFRVADAQWAEARAYLLEREQPSETYLEARLPVQVEGRALVEATLFLSDTDHPQWAGALDSEDQARLIARSCGVSGRNIDYLRDLVAHLRAEGAEDPAMARLLTRAEALHPEAISEAA